MSKQPEITFFIDWSIGQKSVPEALRAVGAIVEVHGDHFAPETADVDWLPVVSEKGWVVLTKDEKIGSTPIEVEAIARASARIFILVSGNLSRQQMVDLFVEALERINKFTQGNQAPFIAKIYKDGKIQLWRNQTQLQKLLKGNVE